MSWEDEVMRLCGLDPVAVAQYFVVRCSSEIEITWDEAGVFASVRYRHSADNGVEE